MEDLSEKLEEIILLENQIGSFFQGREQLFKSGIHVEVDGKLLSSKEYACFLTKEMVRLEEKRKQIIDDLLIHYSLEDLDHLYEKIIGETKVERKERLLTIFDLMEQLEIRKEGDRDENYAR